MMFKILLAKTLVFAILLGNENVAAQIGIKTSNITYIVQGNSSHYQETTLRSTSQNQQYQEHQPFNATANFLNKTLSHLPTGICFKQVPTVSLLQDRHYDVVPAGNGSDPSLSRIQVCCEGYERNAHVFRKCDPICKDECINGLCVAPNQCQCYPDHVRNAGDFCIPTCPIGCGNGVCSGDTNQCVCNEGFKLEVNKKFCSPVCAAGCLNGNCTAPDTCTCNAGYALSAAKKCEPVCTGGCEFGQCVAPEQCSCLVGYQKIGSTCQPICLRGCNNGRCTAPNVCTCASGWTLDGIGTTCIPGCDQPCLNGVCTAPNTCACSRGFLVDETNPFKCLPHCPTGCPNGVCSSPNFCLCNLGFVKDRSIKGSQACVARSV